MQYVYVISNAMQKSRNQYKIGKHTGSMTKLVQRYKTPLINPVVYACFWCNDPDTLERRVLKCLDDKRVKDDNGKKTEWVESSLSKITRCIQDEIEKVDEGDVYTEELSEDLSDSLDSVLEMKMRLSISNWAYTIHKIVSLIKDPKVVEIKENSMHIASKTLFNLYQEFSKDHQTTQKVFIDKFIDLCEDEYNDPIVEVSGNIILPINTTEIADEIESRYEQCMKRRDDNVVLLLKDFLTSKYSITKNSYDMVNGWELLKYFNFFNPEVNCNIDSLLYNIDIAIYELTDGCYISRTETNLKIGSWVASHYENPLGLKKMFNITGIKRNIKYKKLTKKPITEDLICEKLAL